VFVAYVQLGVPAKDLVSGVTLYFRLADRRLVDFIVRWILFPYIEGKANFA
jgi:hypothetical protein